MAAISDEEIVRRRLVSNTIVIRGDYPVRSLAKMYTKLVGVTMNGDIAAVQAVRDEIVGELHSMRQAEQKQAAVCDASRREQRTYEAQQAEVEQSIEKAHRDIAARKEELAAARLQKQRNEENEALRIECMKHAKRSSTRANIARIEEEIKAVDAESRHATETIDLRREHFGALLKHLEDLQGTLDTDEGTDGVDQLQQ